MAFFWAKSEKIEEPAVTGFRAAVISRKEGNFRRPRNQQYCFSAEEMVMPVFESQ